ncbi:pseudouridine synthase [Aquabacterium sp.]|uniref:pseudouridine synthase n=1 Tax=Aquabacterium sp. TaxID=1872578 RepID=UPI003D6D815C
MATKPLPLPTRDGVGPSCVAVPAGPWPTLAQFLRQQFPAIDPAIWAARIEAGEVVDEHGVPVTLQRAFQPGIRLYYYRSLPAETALPFDEVVLFQDEHLVAVDKPHFMPVTPGGRYLQQTLLVRLKRKLGIDTLAPIHRLDRETAGVVLFSIQPSTRGAYQGVFSQRTATKHYEAIAPWRPDLAWPLTRQSRLEEDEHFMQMREVPGEPNTSTHIEVLKVQGDLALYRLSPITGRKHQLRVHCAALGMPIVNDLIYPRLRAQDSDDHARPLQLLAKHLEFTDPITGQHRHFTSQQTLRLE